MVSSAMLVIGRAWGLAGVMPRIDLWSGPGGRHRGASCLLGAGDVTALLPPQHSPACFAEVQRSHSSEAGVWRYRPRSNTHSRGRMSCQSNHDRDSDACEQQGVTPNSELLSLAS